MSVQLRKTASQIAEDLREFSAGEDDDEISGCMGDAVAMLLEQQEHIALVEGQRNASNRRIEELDRALQARPMTKEQELEALREHCKKIEKYSKAEALAFLQRAGFMNEHGETYARFGGEAPDPEDQEPAKEQP